MEAPGCLTQHALLHLNYRMKRKQVSLLFVIFSFSLLLAHHASGIRRTRGCRSGLFGIQDNRDPITGAPQHFDRQGFGQQCQAGIGIQQREGA